MSTDRGWPPSAYGSDVQLDRDDLDGQSAIAPNQTGRQRPADGLRDHQALQLADVGHRTSVHFDDQVLRAEPRPLGRAALNNLDDLDRGPTVLGGESRRQGTRSANDPDEGAAHPPLPHQ